MDTIYKDLIRRYCEGCLTEEDETRLFLWISESQTNMDLFRQEEKVWFENHRMPLAAKIAVDKAYRKAHRSIAMRIAAAVSAAAILIGAFTAIGLHKESNGLTRLDNKTASTIMVPASATTEITLPDSTHVWLNAGSTLRYGRDFNIRNRDIRLEGEAYFEVAHNKMLPFVVHTEDCNVTALGTKFNVYSYPGSTSTHATLLEGSVMVENSTSGLLLSPGQKATVSDNGIIIRSEVDASQYISWINGEIRYDEISLDELFNRLSLLFMADIHHEGLSCGGRMIRASFSREESLESILQAISCLLPLSYQSLQGAYDITEIHKDNK